MKKYRIFVINPGSTSTKLALFENNTRIFEESVFHDSSELLKFPTINDQLPYRMKVIHQFIQEHHIDMHHIDVFMGRGGSCYPVSGGIYRIDDRLIEDTKNDRGGLHHTSKLGVQMAAALQKEYGGQMFMMDPPIVDEYCDLARITGVKGVYRRAVAHVLNLKETARRHAESMGKRYEDCNFIVCHIDGGISVTAHQRGKMIDGNDAGGGEGPFTPTRMGGMAVTDVLELLKTKTPHEILLMCTEAGGLSSHFGTSDSDRVHELVEEGNSHAVHVWQAMGYQIIKYIGSMAAVLHGEVDAILLTGGLVRFDDLVGQIREGCGWIAPIYTYPGEFEMEAMAAGAVRVMTGKEEAKTYPGKPVWNGFPEDAGSAD